MARLPPLRMGISPSLEPPTSQMRSLKNIIEQIIPLRPQARTASAEGGGQGCPGRPAEPSKIVEKVTKKDHIFQKNRLRRAF